MREGHFILLGATGDLALRKIFPALYRAYEDRLLTPSILATGRSRFSREEFLQTLDTKVKARLKICDPASWESFTQQIDYVAMDLTRAEDFKVLKTRPLHPNTLIYFSIAPEFFATACVHLAQVGLNAPEVKIVLEKPLGVDLHSARAIHKSIAQHYQESQIYRIDHYLGKQSVQNLLYLRASNPLLQTFWSKDYIDHVQISVCETLGVESRGGFYDPMGALRDMLQNHMLQMLALLTMPLPASLNANSIRQAKLSLLQSLKPLESQHLAKQVIRAQYSAHGDFIGYRQEPHVNPQSQTETFVALKLEITRSEWVGVPFYLRTGKRMGDSFVEVVVSFKGGGSLVFRIQPNPAISLNLHASTPLVLQSALESGMDAYQRLILDAFDSNQSAFNHQDELEAAWVWLDPILQAWQANKTPLYFYPAGSFGPQEAFELLEREGRTWAKGEDRV
ncbi:glucose-6-phosphate dehydrogenase [Helicobacter felis]|uniref:Glucose-6-phosphate 1-dehydrogenase n=1 Tax=Helicobacter felis (strain ATCC 49179 / CCUG 28539 / NCTC 12436 / CS1) TaxID=936155 RepID=E7A9U9_HELFC|nr:glucose-6-phosphate dehydrogenase [Helicobacter felis]CBY82577.1 glucose 6-phosphate 1-dehydrogenase [Helicobacter felis ATCC 49179]